jgi:serine/threonine-protein kinase
LHAIAFDAETLTTSGPAVQLPNATVSVAPDNGAAQFGIAADGTLVFMAQRLQTSVRSLVWLDRTGRQEPVPFEPGTYTNPRVSPDGTRVALDIVGTPSRDVWILELARATATRLTTSAAEDLLPLWSPDGSRVFFASTQGGSTDLYSQAGDGASEARLELGGPAVDLPTSFTPDGSRLLVYEDFRDLKALVIETRAIEPLLTSNFDERLGEVSPDGRWLAYESDESGADVEVFVRPFPNVAERREKVSIAGGRWPRWGRPGGNELFFVSADGAMMAASVEFTPTLRIRGVTKLFDWERPPANRTGRPYDISPLDGRFLMTKVTQLGTTDGAEIGVVLNAFTELERATSAQ